MLQAYRLSKLVIRNPGDLLPLLKRSSVVDPKDIDPVIARDVDVWSDVVRISDVNAWLEGSEAGYSFPHVATADDAAWFLSLDLWSLREAAYLLCGRTPLDEGAFQHEMHSDNCVARVYRQLKDATISGSLDFHDADGTFVRRRVRPSHAVKWAASRALPVPEALGGLIQQDEVQPPSKPIPRRVAQEEAILAKLAEMGYAPQALPMPKAGMHSPAKKAVKEALKFTTDVMNKAWLSLQRDGRIRYDKP
jgi:hypothetical protein